MERLEAQREGVINAREELIEEHSGEEGLLSEVLEDGKIRVADLKARIKELREDKSEPEELEILESYAKLLEDESTYNKTIRAFNEDLDIAVKAQYNKLSIDEVKHLIVDLKWSFDIFEGIDAIYEAVSHRLANRITELAERYETTLVECAHEVEEYEAEMRSHLERMGFEW